MSKAREKFIPFNQALFRTHLDQEPEWKSLQKIDMQFGGLCDLLSNYVIHLDILGNMNQFIAQINELPNSATLRKKLLAELNQKKIKKGHVLYASNIFQKMRAFLFDIYPHSIFSNRDKLFTDNQINESLVREKFHHLPEIPILNF